MFKKLLISLLLVITVFTSVVPKTALAAAPTWYHSSFEDWIEKVNDPANPQDIYAERYTAAQVEWVIYGYLAWILNSIFGTDLALCFVRHSNLAILNPTANVVTAATFMADCGDDFIEWVGTRVRSLFTYVPSTVPNGQNESFASIFTSGRKLSGITYIQSRLSEFGLVQSVSAATSGFGFEAADPVKALWQASRDIVYFLLVFSLVIMAFMIMFRVKSSPQTVITIQSVLPKIIVGIVAVTFSYAIAGLMIDLMYVSIGFAATILHNSQLFETTGWDQMYSYMSGGTETGGLIYILITLGAVIMFSYFVNAYFIASIVIPLLGGLLGFIILLIAYAIIIFKLIWAMVKNYVTILMLIAAGPFVIFGGVLGGGGLAGWLKTLAAALAVYPAVGIMLAFSSFFAANSIGNSEFFARLGEVITTGAAGYPFQPDSTSLGGSTWAPPFTSVSESANMVWFVLSLILLSLVPKVVDIIKSSMSGKPFAYGSAIGAPLSAGAGVASAPFGFIGQGWNAAQEQLGKSVWSKVSSEVMRRAGR